MIISDAHRYLFVELPHTGTTAIAKELRELYDGRPILHKHARYHQFREIATPEQRGYFVFSGIRNPLDEAVSYYFRFRTDHHGRYSDPANWKRHGGSVSEHSLAQYRFIHDHDADFPAYLRRFSTRPYDNWSLLHHHRMDDVIRFEELSEGFDRVLRRLGIEPRRPLPVVNKTSARRRSFVDYYPPDLRPHAVRIFGPFMERWGYDFPAEWGPVTVPARSRLLFRLLRPVRRARWRLRGHRLFD